MALSIKRADADRLARELSAATGETITEAVVVALRELLERHRQSQQVLRKPSDLFEAGRDRPASLTSRRLGGELISASVTSIENNLNSPPLNGLRHPSHSQNLT